MTAAVESLLDAIAALVSELPPGAIQAVTTALEAGEKSGLPPSLASLGVTAGSRAALARVDASFRGASRVDGLGLSLAIRSAARVAADISGRQQLEIAWTGPSTEAVPMRRVDQVMYELIEGAQEHVLLVTYAAYKAQQALDALKRAFERGVQVDLVIELAEESGGSLSFDTTRTIREQLPGARFYWWPRGKRQSGPNGRTGSMHAKCLVADRTVALVSSANMTDYAMEMNMELGLVIRGGEAPGTLVTHFEQLVARRELVLL